MILVVAEQREGALSRTAWEAIAAAQVLAGAMPVKVVTLGPPGSAAADALAAADVVEVVSAEAEALTQYASDACVAVLRGRVQNPPRFPLRPAPPGWRAYSARLTE